MAVLCACFLVTEFVFQALKCESWGDSPPTQVEEDLWYDSFLSVSATLPMHFSHHLIRVLSAVLPPPDRVGGA